MGMVVAALATTSSGSVTRTSRIPFLYVALTAVSVTPLGRGKKRLHFPYFISVKYSPGGRTSYSLRRSAVMRRPPSSNSTCTSFSGSIPGSSARTTRYPLSTNCSIRMGIVSPSTKYRGHVKKLSVRSKASKKSRTRGRNGVKYSLGANFSSRLMVSVSVDTSKRVVTTRSSSQEGAGTARAVGHQSAEPIPWSCTLPYSGASRRRPKLRAKGGQRCDLGPECARVGHSGPNAHSWRVHQRVVHRAVGDGPLHGRH